MAAYVGPTRKHAKRIIWRELKRFNDAYGLGIVFNETELIATLPNGAQVHVFGANREDDVERLRGSPWILVVVDEAGSIGEQLRTLVDEVLGAAMMDYDGQIVLIGTPTSQCKGLFFEASTGAPGPDGKPTMGWSSHSWTVFENPYVPKRKRKGIRNALEWVADYLKRKGWTADMPHVLREFYGRWIGDSESLVYAFSEKKNTYLELPKGSDSYEWHYGISVDLGYDDPAAIVLFQWCEELPDLYVPWLKKKSEMTPATIAGHIKVIEKRFDLDWVVVDQGGGAGKIVSAEFEERYDIPALPAEKTKKKTFLEFCNGDLRAGRIKIHREACKALIEELQSIEWDPEKPGKESEKFANDVADAFLYGWRQARHHLYEGPQSHPELIPDEDSPEADEEKAEKMLRVAKARAKEKKEAGEDWFAP